MKDIFIEFFIKFLGEVFPWALRRRYPPSRIAGLVRIQVSSDGDGISLINGDIPKAQVWIEVINLSPFPLELDRVYGTFTYGSELEKYIFIQKTKIPASSIAAIHLDTSLTKEHAAIISKMKGSGSTPALSFNAHFLCSVHNFDVSRRIQTTHHRLVNFAAG